MKGPNGGKNGRALPRLEWRKWNEKRAVGGSGRVQGVSEQERGRQQHGRLILTGLIKYAAAALSAADRINSWSGTHHVCLPWLTTVFRHQDQASRLGTRGSAHPVRTAHGMVDKIGAMKLRHSVRSAVQRHMGTMGTYALRCLCGRWALQLLQRHWLACGGC